jgi:hypothetical protein
MSFSGEVVKLQHLSLGRDTRTRVVIVVDVECSWRLKCCLYWC